VLGVGVGVGPGACLFVVDDDCESCSAFPETEGLGPLGADP